MEEKKDYGEFIRTRFLVRLEPKKVHFRSLPRVDVRAYDRLEEATKLSRHQKAYAMHVVHVSEDCVKTVCEQTDERSRRNERLVRNAVKWAKQQGLSVPSTKLYIWISDRQPWFMPGIEEQVPICVFAAPRDSNFLLFPDGSFDALETSGKYNGECLDWDATKLKVQKHTSRVKINAVYFKGVPSTMRHSRVREQLELMSKRGGRDCIGDEALFGAIDARKRARGEGEEEEEGAEERDPRVVVKLDAWQKYEPVWNFARFKYLLNLPGHYPWSNRLKYLFLMRSMVINVDVRTVGTNYVDAPFDTLPSYIFDAGVDYANIEMTYFAPKGRHAIPLPLEQVKENNRVYKEITNIAQNTTKEQYDAMTSSALAKAQALTNEHIYFYIYQLILLNAEVLGE